MVWEQAKGSDEVQPVLQPWIPDSVKVLRKAFRCWEANQVGATVCDGAGDV